MKNYKKNILEIKNLNLKINQTKLLKNINLTVKEGEAIGIIGSNGSSKTVLLNTICGFLKPESGEILFLEKNITNLKVFQRAKLGIKRTFQDFGIFKEISVIDNLILTIENSKKESILKKLFRIKSKNDVKLKAIKYLKMINLEKKKNQIAGNLSGGEMRLLEIMMAFSVNPKIYLFDEPTAGVCSKLKIDLIKLIKKLKKSQKSILIVEHDINFISKFCDKIILIENGQIISKNTLKNITKNKK